MRGATLDTGAFVALEHGDRRMVALLDLVLAHDATLTVPAPVVAQAWRGGGPRQARTARLLRASSTQVVVLDEVTARAVGALAARVGATDVVDVAVVICARQHRQRAITSDPDDLRRVDPALELPVL